MTMKDYYSVVGSLCAAMAQRFRFRIGKKERERKYWIFMRILSAFSFHFDLLLFFLLSTLFLFIILLLLADGADASVPFWQRLFSVWRSFQDVWNGLCNVISLKVPSNRLSCYSRRQRRRSTWRASGEWNHIEWLFLLRSFASLKALRSVENLLPFNLPLRQAWLALSSFSVVSDRVLQYHSHSKMNLNFTFK